MKNKLKNITIAFFAAGTMFFNYPISKADTYSEAIGLEQSIEKEYGEIEKIKMINEKEDEGAFDTDSVEITYKDGTIVTVEPDNDFFWMYAPKKTVEMTVGKKKTIEEYYKFNNSWDIADRTIIFESNGAKITSHYSLNVSKTELEIMHTKVERQDKIEYYHANDFFNKKEPFVIEYITEKIIYPKGTTLAESKEYFDNQNKFFKKISYDSIERKLIEERDENGELLRKKFITILDYKGVKDYEVRIEHDHTPLFSPHCDGSIDYMQSITKLREGVSKKTDLDGDGNIDIEITKRVITIYFE